MHALRLHTHLPLTAATNYLSEAAQPMMDSSWMHLGALGDNLRAFEASFRNRGGHPCDALITRDLHKATCSRAASLDPDGMIKPVREKLEVRPESSRIRKRGLITEQELVKTTRSGTACK